MKTEWQPIETAPKDGRWLLLRSGSEKPNIGAWREAIPALNEQWPEYPACWETDGEGFEMTGVTHWMPIPDPPVSTGKE